jgi:hypothetical protein
MADLSLEHVRDLIAAQGRESRAHWEGVRREMTTGFDGINDRLDRVNGRLDKHGARLTVVERDGAYLHKRADDPAPVARLHSRADDGKPITRRDVAVGLACSGVSIGALIWILQVIGKL